MAYCVRCGAYIPEGQSVCLACGYDPEAAQIALREKAEKEKNAKSVCLLTICRKYPITGQLYVLYTAALNPI